MCNLVPFVRFKKREKHPWKSVTFLLFFTFFELYKWYQIAHSITYDCWYCNKYRKVLINLFPIRFGILLSCVYSWPAWVPQKKKPPIYICLAAQVTTIKFYLPCKFNKKYPNFNKNLIIFVGWFRIMTWFMKNDNQIQAWRKLIKSEGAEKNTLLFALCSVY